MNLHALLPNDIDDPAAPSGGNAYDRRICDGLAAAGWSVHEHAMTGTWPAPRPADTDRLARVLATLPDGALVLIDGLIASAVPEVLVPQADRLSVVVLMHMPLGSGAERLVLEAVDAVVTTSFWTRQQLLDHDLPAERIHVAQPGVAAAPVTEGSASGSRLLCVAAIAPHKGHDLLVQALASIADLDWSCVLAGPLDRDPGFVARLRAQLNESGLDDRVALVGPLRRAELDARYAATDLFVSASRAETYGMAVTEALARGIPVIAPAVGGLPEAIGRAPGGTVPGIVVAPSDPAALAGALRLWLAEPERRDRLRLAARDRRKALSGWETTTELVAGVFVHKYADTR